MDLYKEAKIRLINRAQGGKNKSPKLTRQNIVELFKIAYKDGIITEKKLFNSNMSFILESLNYIISIIIFSN